jgi:hypothetical protein
MTGPLSDDDVARINDALFAGRKIDAIKIYRECTGAGLKDAKDFVEAVEEQLRQSEPGRFTAPPGRGCGLSVFLLFVSAGLMWRALV